MGKRAHQRALRFWCSSAGRFSGGPRSCALEKQRRFGQTRWQPSRLTRTLASRPRETSKPARTAMPPEPGSKGWPISASGRQTTPGSRWRAVWRLPRRGARTPLNQFARTLGFSGEEGERLARQSGQNMEAITKFGTVLTQACQDTSREWYGLAQKQLQRNLEGLSHLAHCRSVQDFAAVQSGLVRESLQHMVEDSRLIAEISLKAVNDASKAVAGSAQEKGRSSALAA